MKKAIILVSGGVDSSTLLALVKNLNYEIHALSFNYSQRHLIELEKIKIFIQDYNVKEHKIINLDFSNLKGSALTDPALIVPTYENVEDLQKDIPITYVPARNTIFLSYALAYAEIINAQDIFIGVHSIDYSNYPDCRQEYITSFEKMANLATKLGIEGSKIKIHTPLINMTKGQIIKTGLELNVDYSKTISCYNPDNTGASCGNCHACLLRLEAFAENNIKDNIKYI